MKIQIIAVYQLLESEVTAAMVLELTGATIHE